MKILTKPDLDELSHATVELLIRLSRDAIEDHDRFCIALSGGSTPRYLYSLLASPKYQHTIDWTAAELFIGDERNVPPDAPESNYRMVREILTDPLGIDEEQVLRWRTEIGDVEQIAVEYERELRERLGAGTRFDLVLLGLGGDGHTASLFPRSTALQETEKLAVPNWVEGLNDYRLTITFPAINRAANVIFLAAGAEKAQVVADVLEGESQPDLLPAQRVNPHDGELYWFIDEAAAQYLTERKP